MLQVWQDNKGHLTLDEVPAPMTPQRGVLVHNRYSLISAGTERSQVDLSRKSLLGKALARPELARQVWQKVKTEGVLSTLNKVNARLDEPVALGYSCAGVVVESTCQPHASGDRVACAGIGFASHAEWVSVPQNLVAAVPDGVSDRAAATATVGAIALHAVRQAEPQIGETVAVVGLGLVGQICVMILAANGCRVIGFDPDPDRAALALQHGACFTSTEGERGVPESGRFAADRVLVTAASRHNGPIELAAALCRDRGRIVLVGDVGANLPRQPFYRKELDLRYARSYGPGRYDASYEEQGHDYPQSYVRWTLQRNMAAYLELVALGKVTTDHLFTHTFALNDAEAAYAVISGDTPEPHLGVLLQYPEQLKLDRKITLRSRPARKPTSRVRLGMIGAGQFGTGVLLPALSKLDVARNTMCTRSGVKAKAAADRFEFSYATTDPQVVIRDPDVDWVVIATPHRLHAPLVLDAMRAGKAVFVEKPLATTLEELSEIEAQYANGPVPIMVGFNRRFAELTLPLKSALAQATEPLLMHYRVLAGRLPDDAVWHDTATGGRIAGELCHFVDYCRFVADSRIVSVAATAAFTPGTSMHPPDHLQVHLTFANSSAATITYAAEADAGCGKEEFTVMGGGQTLILNNFRRLDIWKGGRAKRFRSRGDKGHFRQLEQTLHQLKTGQPMPIPFGELANVTEATLRVLDVLKNPGRFAQVVA